MDKRFVFIAYLNWGKPVLVKAEVLKETTKSFMIGDVTPILGNRTYYKRIGKDEPEVFENPILALQYIAERGADYLKKHDEKRKDACDSLQVAASLLEELRSTA